MLKTNGFYSQLLLYNNANNNLNNLTKKMSKLTEVSYLLVVLGLLQRPGPPLLELEGLRLRHQQSLS
jgi:hypothetical protein